MATPIAIVAYLTLFTGAALAFLFVNLLVGKLVRPKLPNPEKLEVYECGEPTIGSSFVQFDLRFYVVALLFIIFDVEVAFFFPWATVFGKATQLASRDMPIVASQVDPAGSPTELSPQAAQRLSELGISSPVLPSVEEGGGVALQQAARRMALASLGDIGVFFGVLMVGFAYVWRRGDLDWVRSVRSHANDVVDRAPVSIEVEPRPVRQAGSILSA